MTRCIFFFQCCVLEKYKLVKLIKIVGHIAKCQHLNLWSNTVFLMLLGTSLLRRFYYIKLKLLFVSYFLFLYSLKVIIIDLLTHIKHKTTSFSITSRSKIFFSWSAEVIPMVKAERTVMIDTAYQILHLAVENYQRKKKYST